MKVIGRAEPGDQIEDRGQAEDDFGVRWSQRVRALLLGPHGGGRTRRRASDAVRLGIAIAVVGLCIPLVQANTSVELGFTELISPAPWGIRWLITALWYFGSIGVIVGLVLVGLLVPKLVAVRRMALAGVFALGVCLLLDLVIGPNGGRPPVDQVTGIDPRYPVIQLAVATAVALTGLPYLSRPVQRLVVLAIGLAAICAVVGGYGFPLNVVAAIVVGWGTAAAGHLALGAPNGLPSADEVTDGHPRAQGDRGRPGRLA